MATQPLTATFSVTTLEALSSIATPDEINTLQAVLDLISHGRGKLWMFEYVARILARSVQNDSQVRQQ